MEELDFANPLGALRQNPIYLNDENISEMSVLVRNAVTPWNFHVTDYCRAGILENLENKMTQFYKGFDSPCHILTFDELKLGGFYAVEFISDGNPSRWLRCEIVKPFKKDLPSITVRLVDSGGFYQSVPTKFYKLLKEFCMLPMQAMEATLHVVTCSDPTMSKLSVASNRHLDADECRRFYTRVEGKHFFAFLLNPSESRKKQEVLRLILVDTSTESQNQYIHEEFNLKLDSPL